MENFNSIPVLRHLDDVDDLREYGRDGILLPNQESAVKNYAEELINNLHEENKQALLLLCSTAKRGVQTGQLISEEVKEEDPAIKVVLSENPALANMYEGEINLPDSYKAGDKFPGFSIGKKAFAEEVFGQNPNFLYRFGDPVDLGDGRYKYPELLGYFTEFGESYRDFMVRLLKLILDTAHNIERTQQNTKVVAVTHSLQYQMFYDLQGITEDIISGDPAIESGKLALICWERYQERIKAGVPTYEVRYIDIDNLCNEKVLSFLVEEINYLNSLN